MRSEARSTRRTDMASGLCGAARLPSTLVIPPTDIAIHVSAASKLRCYRLAQAIHATHATRPEPMDDAQRRTSNAQVERSV